MNAARLLAAGFVALLVSGCCSSTWFRSCGPAQEPVPVPLASSAPAGEVHGEFPFSWVTRDGVLIVTVEGLPEGRWLVQARRPGGWVVGQMEIAVPGGTGLTEIEIWPSKGNSLPADVYPVFTRG